MLAQEAVQRLRVQQLAGAQGVFPEHSGRKTHLLPIPQADAGGALTAVVSVDGTEVDRVALDRLSGPERRSYEAGGYHLTVEFSPEGAVMAESDCPTQDCVHTGAVHDAGRSIVCLPARLTVRLTGGTGGGVDAVVG